MGKSFKTWFEEQEVGLANGMPQYTGDGITNTPGSNAVLRTGLQPQVDSQEIATKSNQEQDKILAIDSQLQRLSTELPAGSKKDFPKVNKFRVMWDRLKEKWEKIKQADHLPVELGAPGLGSDTGDPKYLQQMQQYPNMVPTSGQNALPSSNSSQFDS